MPIITVDGKTLALPNGAVLTKARLPKEYQEVEWVQCENTTNENYSSYIALTWSANNTSRAVAKFMPIELPSGLITYGVYGHRATTQFGYANQASNSLFYFNSTNNKPTTGSVYGEVNHLFEIDQGRYSSLKIDGELVLDNHDFGEGTFQVGDTNFRVGQFWVSGSGILYYVKINFYYFALYNGADLIFELIPCYRKSDSVIGFYDLAKNVFRTSANVPFTTKGPDVSTL